MPFTIASSSKSTRFEWLGGAVAEVAVGMGAAEEHHRPRHPLEHVAPVLGAHDRVGLAHDLVGADDLLGDAERGLGEVLVVDGDGVAGLDLDVDRTAVGGGDALDDAADAVVHPRAGLLADGTDRALDLGGLGDHVVRRPGADPPDGDDGGVEDVDAAG